MSEQHTRLDQMISFLNSIIYCANSLYKNLNVPNVEGIESILKKKKGGSVKMSFT